jgi:hypothetical protein
VSVEIRHFLFYMNSTDIYTTLHTELGMKLVRLVSETGMSNCNIHMFTCMFSSCSEECKPNLLLEIKTYFITKLREALLALFLSLRV